MVVRSVHDVNRVIHGVDVDSRRSMRDLPHPKDCKKEKRVMLEFH